jgi:hypothetical protein
MIELTRSRPAMVLAVGAAVAWAISSVLQCIAFAILSGPLSALTAHNLLIAASWLETVAGIGALAAVSSVVWPLVIRRQWNELWEVGGVCIATLLIAIGLLASSATAPDGSQAANVVTAIGIGGWAIALAVKAGRHSIDEQKGAAGTPQAGLWLAASVALVLTAVGFGLPNTSVQDQGLALATNIVQMLGVIVLAFTLAIARRQGFLASARGSVVTLGLWTLAIAYAISVVVDAVVFGPSPSLTGLRVGLSLAAAVEAMAFLVLALAAWGQVTDLVSPARATPTAETPGFRPGCGHPVPANSQYCPQCGAPTGASSSS